MPFKISDTHIFSPHVIWSLDACCLYCPAAGTHHLELVNTWQRDKDLYRVYLAPIKSYNALTRKT